MLGACHVCNVLQSSGLTDIPAECWGEAGTEESQSPAALNNVRKQHELQGAYWNSLFLHGDSKPQDSKTLSSVCCQDTMDDPVARIQIATNQRLESAFTHCRAGTTTLWLLNTP